MSVDETAPSDHNDNGAVVVKQNPSMTLKSESIFSTPTTRSQNTKRRFRIDTKNLDIDLERMTRSKARALNRSNSNVTGIFIPPPPQFDTF